MFIPVMKLIDRGKPVEAFFELLRANVRTPEEVLGDIHSQVVGNEAGAMQLLSFLDEFALEDLEELADAIVERSEAAMRERIRALPDGRYPYELTIDGFEDPLVLKAAIIVEGDELTVDFAGSPGPVPLGINVTLNYTHAYTTYGVKCVLAGDIPNNEGSFIPVHVTAPDGSLLNAKYPAAVGGRHLVGHFLPSVVMGALAGAMPDNVMAPGFDGLWDTHVSGVDRRSGEHFSFTWFSAGGTGALKGKDGLSATAYPSGIAGVPAEVIEALAPLVIRRRELRPDSGGPGESRGVLARPWRWRCSPTSPTCSRACTSAPGSRPLACTADRREARAGSEPTTGSSWSRDLAPGAGRYRGGAGDAGRRRIRRAATRDPALVLEDVRDGYVSTEQALEAYGVVVDTGTWTVDEVATARRRAEVAARPARASSVRRSPSDASG